MMSSAKMLYALCTQKLKSLPPSWDCDRRELTVLGEASNSAAQLQQTHGPQEHATCPFDDSSVDESKSLPRMAPNLAESQHAQIRDMILSNRPAA